jgi:hypothetical protein
MTRLAFVLPQLVVLMMGGALSRAEEKAAQADELKPALAFDPAFFPIAVWLQSPRNAERFKAAGINTYVGLWRGPTDEQLDSLKAAGMRVVCAQNETALSRKDDPTIVAWMHGDEPDNAQPKRGGGYGPPIEPAKIVEDYRRMKERDPSRPVLLNLGQGVAWDDYIGRGVRRRHPEDYAEYVKGCDIASFDIYPAVHDDSAVAGNLWYVAHGVTRLRKWSGPDRPVWNCIEASRISNTRVKPTPAQVKAEVWMSIVHGSRGIIYFVHQFEPRFVEASLLEDESLLKAVTSINREVRELAAVINAPEPQSSATVTSSDAEAPVASMTRRHEGATYLFAVAMRNKGAQVSFKLPGIDSGMVEVLGEARSLPVVDGAFHDEFGPYEVHLYRHR